MYMIYAIIRFQYLNSFILTKLPKNTADLFLIVTVNHLPPELGSPYGMAVTIPPRVP